MRLLILPYAHSKKIFLNNLKPNTEYFYTSIEKHIHNHEKKGERGGHDSIDESSEDSSDDGPSSSRSDSSCPQSDKDTQHQSMVLIICLNMTDHK